MKANKNELISQHTHTQGYTGAAEESLQAMDVHIYSILLYLTLIQAIDAGGFQVSLCPSRLLLLPFLVIWVEQLL